MTVAKAEQINKKKSHKMTNFDHLSENICHLVSWSDCNKSIFSQLEMNHMIQKTVVANLHRFKPP